MHSILSLVHIEQTSRLMTYRALPVGMIPNLFMNKMNRCTLEVQVEPCTGVSEAQSDCRRVHCNAQ